MSLASPHSSLEELGTQLEGRSLLDYMVDHTEGDVSIPYKEDNLDEEAYVQAVMDIHFDETYGTPFWRKKMDELGFDPREEVESIEDLRKLGEADEEALRERPVQDFMPRLFARAERGSWDKYDEVEPDLSMYDLSKSSGSTGKKKIMPWREPLSDEAAEWYSHNFDVRDIDAGNWIVTGPSGLYEGQMVEAAKKRGQNAYFNGVETRRLKPQTKELGQLTNNPLGFAKEALTNPGKVPAALQGLARMKYSLQAMEEDLESEEVEVLASVPAVTKRAHGMLESDSTVSNPGDIEAVIMSGMEVNEKILDEVSGMYENAEIVPMYATSFTGPNFDNPDTEDLEYQSLNPFISFGVIEQGGEPFQSREEVEYGERGQVVLNHLSEGFLWPNQTERETAERREPSDTLGTDGDGIADIRPLDS